MNHSRWRETAQAELGVSLGHWQKLGGGDFAQSWQATVISSDNAPLAIEDIVFIKTHANPPPFHFSTEAVGLSWLHKADGVKVPQVLGVSDDPPFLALEWIDEGSSGSRVNSSANLDSEGALGIGLAALHGAPCSQFGRQDQRTTGSLGLPNEPCDSWATFYATQRLLPLSRIAADRQALSRSTVVKIEQLAERLSEFSNADVLPSLLHGDLWAGNRLIDSDGCNWLIDPACHRGHREFDLAMMRLFGGYGEQCFASYNEHFPLDDGWQARIALHQLAPLIVHAIKFGASYVAPTENALNQYV